MQKIDMNNIAYKSQEACPVCNSTDLNIIGLPQYPITEMYAEWQPDVVDKGFIDQSIMVCDGCQHAFLEKILDVKVIYGNYITTSAASQGALDCLEKFKSFVDKNVDINECSLMLDIGGNDSTFLSYYKDSTLNLVNLDPNASGGARYELNKDFLEDVDWGYYKKTQKKILVSSHTIEHLEQPNELIKKIGESLNADDYCFLQFPSIESLVKNMRFDQITHQHINLFSLSSIQVLLNKHGLCIVDYEYDDAHYGTLRVAARQIPNNKPVSTGPRLTAEIIDKKFESFKKYFQKLNVLLEPIFKDGTGFGAGLIVPTLSYYLPVVRSLKYIIDENESKHGKRFVNLPAEIIPLSELNRDNPILITSVSTNSAARSIFNKLCKLDVQKIVLPTIIT